MTGPAALPQAALPQTALPRLPARDARIVLLCFPYGGGGSQAYQSWTRYLPATVDALTARLPGREARMDRPAPEDLPGLATEIVREVGAYLTGRLVLFGHSMGALLAFEFARELRRMFGSGPDCLVVSGMCAPQLLPERPTVLAGLDDPELRATITALGQLGPEVSGSDELWDILLPIIRADIRMCERYLPVPGPPLDCPVIAYGSDDDGDLDERALAAWGEQTTGPFDSRVFEGNHFFFTAQPAAFAADLLHRIAQQVPAAQLTDTPADGGTR